MKKCSMWYIQLRHITVPILWKAGDSALGLAEGWSAICCGPRSIVNFEKWGKNEYGETDKKLLSWVGWYCCQFNIRQAVSHHIGTCGECSDTMIRTFKFTHLQSWKLKSWSPFALFGMTNPPRASSLPSQGLTVDLRRWFCSHWWYLQNEAQPSRQSV